MDEQNTKPESNFVNTATQKTVRLKPMVKQPVVNIGQPAKVASVSTNSQPLATSVIEAKNVAVNTTRPAPLPATATMPVKKISIAAKPTAAAGGNSILNSLNLKPKAETPAAPTAAATPSNNAESTNTAVVSKVKIAGNVSAAFKDTIASSVAPTQKFVPTSNLNTSTSKVQKVAVSAESVEETDDKTVKLQRPERKQATVANTVVPTLTPKAEEKVVEETPKTEDNTATVAVDKVTVAPATPKLNIAPKAEEKTAENAVKAEDNTSTVAVDKVATPATPKLNIAPKAKAPTAEIPKVEEPKVEEPKTAAPQPSAAPTVKLSLGQRQDTPKAEEPKAAPSLTLNKKEEPKEAEAKPKIGIAKKPEAPKVEEAKAEEPKETKLTDSKVQAEKKVKILPKNTVSPMRSPAYMIIMIIVFFMVVFGAVVSALQYLNTFEQERVMKDKVIEIPIINDLIKK
ncbi:MAG: hypothetical protein IKD09_04115 [Lentisphaeria bacterium]|nr:hypothetical protein [Lentisphaeria bacterium]